MVSIMSKALPWLFEEWILFFFLIIVLFCDSYYNSHSKESLRPPNQGQLPCSGNTMICISHCRSILWASSSVAWGQYLLYMTKREEIVLPFGWPAWMCSPQVLKDTSHSMMSKHPNNCIISFRYTSMACRSTGPEWYRAGFFETSNTFQCQENLMN